MAGGHRAKAGSKLWAAHFLVKRMARCNFRDGQHLINPSFREKNGEGFASTSARLFHLFLHAVQRFADGWLIPFDFK